MQVIVDDPAVNQPPIANAETDQTISLPLDSALLNGSLSFDPDGTIVSYQWLKLSGPSSFTISSPAAAQALVKNLSEGLYSFELSVTDNGGLSGKDTVSINVSASTNHPPVAKAGNDQTITLPTNTTTLDGSGSADPENNITSYEWRKITGPTSFSIANTNVVQTQVTNLVQGVYEFELKVTNAGGLFARDTIGISISLSTGPISVSGCNQMMVPFGHLSQPRSVRSAVTAGNKIFFKTISNGGITEIYDTATQTWSTSNQPIGNITIGTKIVDAHYQYPVNTEIF